MVAAVAALVVTPLLALSYFGIADGASALDQTTVSAWADPAGDRLGALLTWSAPDRVYATYIPLFALLFPAGFLCALAVRSRRAMSEGCLERWSWRIALSGYGLCPSGFVAVAPALIGASPGGTAVNTVFLVLLMPGMLLSLIGTTMLGIALLRNRYTPRLTAWLLKTGGAVHDRRHRCSRPHRPRHAAVVHRIGNRRSEPPAEAAGARRSAPHCRDVGRHGRRTTRGRCCHPGQ